MEAPSRGGAGGHNPAAAPARKTSRRSATKEYLAAAKARRRETELYNKRHPPKSEDFWICHFCEYEWIFGHPPEALARAYEIKERKQRQVEEQRRAQWERMKKGKHKGKKNSKLPAKNSTAAQDAHHHLDAAELLAITTTMGLTKMSTTTMSTTRTRSTTSKKKRCLNAALGSLDTITIFQHVSATVLLSMTEGGRSLDAAIPRICTLQG
ncbi:hypothetical protein NEMBOFW57_001736 [Staphylotrichum longicolle]|uniref:Uncharacterized protein n=1 Tax=Staphylotrichum longicolle TaxID=669026 RepID=A0AAD4F215_9PEZI|nr:hypothetical protein NEMBOFW57_001736 [Staphylotrichum longicolle]